MATNGRSDQPMGLEVALALLGIGDAVSLVLYDRVGQPDLLVGGFGPAQGSQDTGVGKVDLLGADPALVGLGHQRDSPLRVFHRCPRLTLCQQGKANFHLAPHLADWQRALLCDTHGFARMLQRAGEIPPWFGSRRGDARRELPLGAGQGSQPGRQALLASAVSVSAISTSPRPMSASTRRRRWSMARARSTARPSQCRAFGRSPRW
jgi:hypothetical protein